MAKYTFISKPMPPLDLPDAKHNGTGAANLIKSAKHYVSHSNVSDDRNTPFDIIFKSYNIRVYSLNIETKSAPNWYGVSFREDIGQFDSVVLFFHPFPRRAGMEDSDYNNRSGSWPKLFRYAEMIGSQMDMAYSNLVIIVPFFSNAVYGSTGIFGPDWLDITTEILRTVRLLWTGGTDTYVPTLKNVILADFSRGRDLLIHFHRAAPGISKYVRAIWDFDGVGGAAPHLGKLVSYDQADVDGTYAKDGKTKFHAPMKRFFKFHHADKGNSHGDIPVMLAGHASWVSDVA